MKKLENAIMLVQDKATRDALTAISQELKRIKQVRPVKADLESVAIAINTITGKI